MKTLRGCIPILCTPFTEQGTVDASSLEKEVEWVLAEGAAGVAALALAGEGYKLTETERRVVTKVVVDTVAGRVPVVVSADGGGTAVAVERATTAAKLGADALMVLPPSFVKPDLSSLLDYYVKVGQAVEIPVIIQDAPQLTGVTMEPRLWAVLAENVPTIRYVKAEDTSRGSTLADTLALGEGRLAVFTGWGGLGILDALAEGAVGCMPAPNFTRLFATLQALAEQGRAEEAAARYAAALPYLEWSMRSIDVSVAAAKIDLHRCGVFHSPHVRRPTTTLDDAARRELDAFITERIMNT